MKDSGADWVGGIPEGWDMRRGKYLFEESSKKGGSDLTLLSPTQAFGVVPQDQLEGVVRVKVDTDFTTFKTVVPDDFIISLRSFQGGFEWSHISGVCSPAYTVFHASSTEVWPAYYARMFKCSAFIEKMDNITRGIREGKNIGYVDFSNTFLPFLPLDEQQRIADYLDERCAAIDEVRRTIEDEVEALRRLRKATIHRAVTKGLDEGVPMRDSGVEWIGEMPNGWALGRIGGLYKHRNTKVSDADYPPLSVTMKGVLPQLETAAKTNDHDNRKLVRIGDFAINSRSDRRGSCGISAYDGSVSLINTVLEPRDEMSPGFYNMLFHSAEFAAEFYRWGHGIVDDLWTTRWQDMKAMKVPVPPLAEQQRIADYLDERCAAIDSVIDTRTRQLERLDDYRRALIFAYVTGKKEVPFHE